MNDLHVFDVSPMVYVGDCGQDVKNFEYPVGGIQFVLSRLAVAFGQDDQVIMCFDSPSFRKQKASFGKYDYKGGRESRPQVYSQIETLYEGLQKCGIRCEKFPKYEADDIVDWAIKDNAHKYSSIYLYTNDYDLCHSVRDNVTLCPVSKSMNVITCYNFEESIKKGEKIPYNTISAYKVFHGCKSDNIPPMKLQCGYPVRKIFDAWVGLLRNYGFPFKVDVGLSPDILIAFVNNCGLFQPEEIEDVRNRIELIYPAAKPEGVQIEPVYYSEVDKRALAYFCSMYNAQKALNCMGLQRCSLTEYDKKLLRSKGRSLLTGEYAADKDLKFDTQSVKSSVLSLDSFEKEF